MNINGLTYLLFLALVWLASLLRPSQTWRKGLLLAASYGFYATWNPWFTLLLAAASGFNHLWAHRLRRRSTAATLWIGLAANLGLLLGLKYLPALWARPGEPASWTAPVGVSFFTFQAISYLVDVYRGFEERPTWVEFFLYMAFWPTILAGPICRLPEMLPQYRRSERANAGDVSTGFRRIVLGLFMKVVVADTLARGLAPGSGIDAAFKSGAGGTLDVLLLGIGYGFQLFFDFAGYSHAAIGAARLFGLRLRENFDAPYLASNISEFWNRWHMSLSSWIRDYLFFPLATLRPGLAWRTASLVAAMTLFGIWHGVGATFAVWGLYHGLLLAAHRQFQQWRRRRRGLRSPGAAAKLVAWSATFAAVNLGWIFFRSPDLSRAADLLGALVHPTAPSLLPASLPGLVFGVAAAYFAVAATVRLPQLRRPGLQRWAGLASPVLNAVLILLIIVWSDASSPFVYVRF